jgi:hypothetical protein
MYAPRGGVCATVIAEASIGVTSTIVAATIAAMITFIDMDILHIESKWVTMLICYELFFQRFSAHLEGNSFEPVELLPIVLSHFCQCGLSPLMSPKTVPS